MSAALQTTSDLKDMLILVVDDEESIRRTLSGVFEDEGFRTISASNGEQALELIASSRPSLVVLDIWMPGMDGMQTLARIKATYPDLPVVMVSGHASISTAVRSTKMGAVDFIEKPLDLQHTLTVTKRALGLLGSDGSLRVELLAKAEEKNRPVINPVAFSSVSARGRRFPQRTLGHSALLYGQGLHTGQKSGLILEPLPPNSGIHFSAVSEPEIVPAHLNFVTSLGYATTLKLGKTQAGTIEHIMSALHAAGVSNLLIKCNNEVPVMDGSAIEFCKLFEEIGLEEQDGDWYEIEITKPLEVRRGKEWIRIEPSDEFTVDYTLDYPAPLGRQQKSFRLDSWEAYKSEIASARTFGFVKDIEWLQRQGLGLGGRFDNFVLFGDEGPINSKLRYSDEPVRHKILDLIGDLFLLGRRIRGKVSACMTGHSDNAALLGLIRDSIASH